MHFEKMNWKVKGLKTIQIVKGKEILQIPVLGSSSLKTSISDTSLTQMEPILKQSFLIFMLNHGQIFPSQALTWERYQEKA